MNATIDTYYGAASRLAISVIHQIDDSPEAADTLLSDEITAERVAEFRSALTLLSEPRPACNRPRLWAENPAPRCQRTAGHAGGHSALTPDGLVSWVSAKAVSA